MENDPALEFYRQVYRGFRSLNPDLLLQAYGLCPLPFASYHVTAFDVANVADLTRCHATARDGLGTTLGRLPSPEAFGDPLLGPARGLEGGLSFRYGELRIWGSVVVVALEPTDAAAFEGFVASRAILSRSYRDTYGVGAKEGYTPHLSLGYFMNSAGAELARARRRDWDDALGHHVSDTALEFSSASLHGFTDMATFFREPRV